MPYRDIINELQDLRYLSWSRIRRSSGTAGSFLKAYEVSDGRKIYYKLSSYDAASGITGHECVNELIADRLLSVMGIEHLHYKLIHALVTIDGSDHETWLCASEDFKNRGDSKIALDDYYEMNRNAGESPLEFCIRMGWEEYIYEMLLVDFLILNRDRHGANIEIVKSSGAGTVYPAPLFDHGMSFVCRCLDEESVKQFDPVGDRPVQCFVGSGSSRDNLAIIPEDRRPAVRRLEERDRAVIFAGLDDVLPQAWREKIWAMIWERWNYYEGMQDSR